ncbi:MAG: hemolysin family protein [Dehalococcoidia bacterium]
MMTTVAIIVAMIILNGLYVAGEFAAVSVRRTRIRQLAEEGNRSARWMLRVIESGPRLDRYVAGCQIGITLSSLLLGAFGQATVTPVVADALVAALGMTPVAAVGAAATGTLIGLTSLQVVFGELLPKSIALQFPTQSALYTSLPMRASLWVFRPLIAILNGSGIAILRLLRAPAEGHRHIHSPGEISLLIAESRDGGILSEHEQERFDRALRLSVLPVRRLMVPRTDVIGVRSDATLEEVLATLSDAGFTRLPVHLGDFDRVVGVLHAKDVAARVAAGDYRLRVSDIMRPIAMVPESMRAERLVAELARQHSEQAVVVDEHGGMAGLVTLEDLLVEVLGGTPATRPGEATAERLPDGAVRLPGRMRVDEAREWLGVAWEGESDTIGGIVLEHLGRMPEPGDRVAIDDVTVEVEAVENLAVVSLLARPVPAEVAEGGGGR